MEMVEPEKVADNWRNPDGTLKPGHPGMGGRPPGKTLKEFAREYLMSLPDDQKIEYLKSVGKDITWKMAEGNPANATDLTTKGDKILIVPAELIEKHVSPSSAESNS